MDGYSKRQHCQRTGPGFDVIDLDSEAGSMPSTKPVPGVNRCEAPCSNRPWIALVLNRHAWGPGRASCPVSTSMAEDYVWDTKSNGHRD
jgi:hypothetical protein